MTLLSAQNLSHSYDYPLFENLSIELCEKKSLAVVGVSGCGKSTLLHICSSLLKPQSGEVFYKGISLYKKSLLGNNKLLNIRRNDFGIIFQSHYLFKGFLARENIELANILSKTNFDASLLEKLGISHVLDQNIGELSGGQQQRISIARVLSKKPRIIFADEPTGNLDAKTAREVMDVLFAYVQEHDASLMLVTHDANLAKQCDEVRELKDLNLNKL